MGKKVTVAGETKRAEMVYERLHEHYPDAKVSLDYKDPLQLLVATILAAQCTDVRVNVVTKDLFKKYKKAADYAAAPREELAKDIVQCGFFNQKAASIQKTSEILLRDYGGKVPGTMAELVKLPGVGRKTANVILGACFDTPGIIVDTHVRRVSGRLEFTKDTDPPKGPPSRSRTSRKLKSSPRSPPTVPRYSQLRSPGLVLHHTPRPG